MRRLRFTSYCVIAIVGAVAPLLLPNYFIGMATEVLIFALFAMSLDLMFGYAGLRSLGHAAFFGVGGYTVALMSLRVTSSVWVMLPAALVLAAVCGAIFALFALRARGGYFLMITLALAQVLWGIAIGWAPVTGGEHGLPGIPPPELGLPINFAAAPAMYLYVLAVVLGGGFLLWRIVQSPFGYVLRGVRESETRMAALGYDVWKYKFAAFVLSAAFAGLAGALWVNYNRFANPEFLHIAFSAKVLLMVAVGGAGTLIGPAFGAAIIVLLEKILSSYTDRWLLVLGAIYVLITLFASKGIIGLFATKRWRRKAP